MAEYTDYVSPASLAETDPYLFSKRGLFQGIRALPGSAQTLSPAEFQALLAGQQGAYGASSALQYDPTFGIYTGAAPGQEEAYNAQLAALRETQTVPNIDPRLMTDVERIRSNMMGGGTYGRTLYEGDTPYRLGASSFARRIGDKKYFVNPDGTVTAYDVVDIRGDIPTFDNQNQSSDTTDTTASNGATGTTDNTTTTSSGVTYDQVADFYRSLLGRDPGADNPNVQNWVNSGLSLSDIESQIAGSPEGQAYAASQTTSSSEGGLTDAQIQAAIDAINSGFYDANAVANSLGVTVAELEGLAEPFGGYSYGSTATTTSNAGTTSNTSGSGAVTDYSDQIAQYYQELFGRGPQPAGAEYWQGQLASGAFAPDQLRDQLVGGAQGLDKTYYEASQSGGPLFTATQELFGRAPVRGQYDESTGTFMGGFDKYRPMYDEGVSDAVIRQQLLDAAYARGEGGGRSQDYQAYLNTLGIDRANSPFVIDGGFANVPYGGDLSAYQAAAAGSGNQTQTGTPQFPFLGGKYGGMGGTGKGGGYTPGGQYQVGGGGGGTPPATGGGYGGVMPQQYVTGNQLYSGLPYGFTTPYGMAGQYMPSRGLMSGFSTGYGPYGGYQRPRYGGGISKGSRYGGGYGGGKGGYGVPTNRPPIMMYDYGGYNPYDMGGFGGGYNPYAASYGGGYIEENPVVGPNGERLYDR